MALLWIEGFESFGQTNGNNPVGLQGKYDYANDDTNFTIQAGRVSGKAMRLPSTGTAQFGKVVSTGSATLIVGFGFYQDAFTGSVQMFEFLGPDKVQGALEIQTSGLWKYYRGTGTLLGTSSGSAVSASTWTYIEIKVTFHTSAGTVDIWVNGSNVLSLTGQNTSQDTNNSAVGFIFYGSPFSNDHTQYDDLYVLDATGSNNNARLGAQVVKIIYPASDGGTNQFTTNSGPDHYNRVNENTADGDSTYLEDSTSTDRELFVMDNLVIGTVAGLQMNTVCENTDNTIYSLKNSLHTTGGTDSDDSAQTLGGVGYQTLSRVVETNPETSALWHVAAINAAKFGFKVG